MFNKFVSIVFIAMTCHAFAAEPPSFLAVPRLADPPTIDGVFAEGEWARAASISGVEEQASHRLHPRPTTFYLGWDADRLYLACRAWIMPGYPKPVAYGRRQGQAQVGDDGLELHFQPMGSNLPKGQTTTSSYKFFINGMGFWGEPVRVSVGQLFRNWQPNFVSGASTTEPGSGPKGGRWLTIEWSGSIDDFKLGGPNQPGDEWRVMLGFNHLPVWMQARIPASSGYFDPSGYTRLKLVDNQPVVQMTMDDMPSFCDGVAAVQFRVINVTRKPVNIDLQAHAEDAAGKLIDRTPTLTVEPGATETYSINEKLPRQPKSTADKGSLQCRVAHGDNVLLHYRTLFSVGYPKNYTVFQARRPFPEGDNLFPLKVGFNPVRSNLQVSGDRYFLDDLESIRAMRYRVTKKDGDKQLIHQATLTEPRTHYFQDFAQLSELAAGRYVVEASLVRDDGTLLGPQRAEFNKLDESEAFSEWWNNDLGGIERVIPPFTAMNRSGTTVTCWGREYTLNRLGLPTAIVSREAQMMAAPARIVTTVDGKETSMSLKRTPRFTETEEYRVAFTGKAGGAGLEFTVEGWVEQDGLTHLKVTYGPAGRKPVTVDALRIEFPLTAETAESLLCIGNGGNYSTRTTMLLPEKEGRLWGTLDMGRAGSGMTVGSFFPMVWLGNEQRGLLWWGDSDRGWVPRDDVSAHEVYRDGDTVVLRNNIIGRTAILDAPRTVEFGYMASPFRPLVKGWRAALGSWDGTFSGPHKKRVDPDTGKEIDGWHWISPPSTDPEEWDDLWASYKKQADEKVRRERPFSPIRARNWYYVHTSLPLQGYGYKSGDDRVTRYFNSEWADDCYTKSNADYYLYLIDRAIREGGLRTIYWDIFFPRLRASIQNGIAYTLPDGRVQPGYVGFNIRRFLMRTYALMDEHGLTPGSQVAHATNAYLLVAAPWVDALLDGEYHKLTDNSTMDWVDGYPIEHMRTLASGHNWGLAISWMDHIHIQDKARLGRVKRGLVDYVRLYDSWQGYSQGYLPKAVLDWGMNESNVEYVPFWRNPYVSTHDPDILASLWRWDDRILLAVFNYNGEKVKNAVVKLDLDRLDLLPERTWQDFIGVRDLVKGGKEPDSKLDFYERTLTVPALQPHTGRVIGIRRY